jgi:hypothetical protein
MKEMPVFIEFPLAPVTQIHWRTTGAKLFAPPVPAP